MRITYWSDFACPYCYIGISRLEKAIARAGLKGHATVEMRAFELDPGAPTTTASKTPERFAHKYGLSLEEAKNRVEHISALGRAEGIDFNYATTRYTNTFDAHRLAKLAHSLGNHAVDELLYRAYFVENLELSDHKVLARIAQESGLPAEQVQMVLEGDEYADAVRTDEREAAMLGIHGVPFFVVDSKAVMAGCYAEDDMVQTLTKMASKKTSDVEEASAFPSCGPQGCAF